MLGLEKPIATESTTPKERTRTLPILAQETFPLDNSKAMCLCWSYSEE
jgi:hypothetical protein